MMTSLQTSPSSTMAGFVNAWAWIWRRPAPSRTLAPHTPRRVGGSTAPAERPSARGIAPSSHALRPRASQRPLRVLQLVETAGAAPHGGRMRISGRMADVCAELDRMVEREAALQA